MKQHADEKPKKSEMIHSAKTPTNVMTRRRKVVVALLIIFWTTLIVIFQYATIERGSHRLPLILSVTFIYLIYKLGLSLLYQPQIVAHETLVKSKLTVSVVMPSFNENANSVMRAIESLVIQTYPIKEIIFVDDGSNMMGAYEAVCHYMKKHKGQINGIHLIAHRFDENRGKRQAQAWGFKRATGDLIQLVDSDGTLLPDATEELVKVFVGQNGKKVGAVVGYVGVRNTKKNMITTMQDMSYCAAFSVGRAAQSLTHSVVVCSGALSMHRRAVILAHLDEFLNERVLKIKVKNGDDRRLTVISRKNGWQTKYQSTAICHTEVPDTVRKLIKQRIRWSRSSYLCSIQNIFIKPWKYPLYVIYSFLEAYLWLITLVLWFIFSRDVDLTLEFLIDALIFYILVCYANKVYYVFRSPVEYLFSPIYSVLYGGLLILIRLSAILALFKYGWGTRRINNG